MSLDTVARGMAGNALNRNASNLMNGRIAAIGDSLTYQCAQPDPGSGNYTTINAIGYLGWLQAISRGKFSIDPALIKGVQGQTLVDMAARYDTDIAPNYGNFDVLVIQGGANDITQLLPTATSFNAAQGMAEKALTKGKVVILLFNLPRSYWGSLTAPQIVQAKALASELNQRGRQYAQTRANVFFVDPWRDLVDASLTGTSEGGPDTLVSYDGLHMAPRGGYRWARRFNDTVGNLYPGGDRSQTQWDQYDATNNPRGNILPHPSFGGSGGSIANATGVVPDGFGLSRYGGASTAVAISKPALAANGYDSPACQSVRITPTVAAGARWFGGLTCSQDLAGLQSLAGKTVFAECEIVANSLVNCAQLQLYCLYYNGSAAVGPSFFNVGYDLSALGGIEFPNSQTLLFRSPTLTLPGTLPGGTLIQWSLFMDFNPAAASLASGSFDVLNPVLRRVS